MALQTIRWLFGLTIVLVLRQFLGVSPFLLLGCVLLLLCCLTGGRGTSGREQVPPLHESGLMDGVLWAVTAIQGRRPYMEDMHQAASLADACGSAGLTHFFAVFDGHGGKRAAAWAQAHLLRKFKDRVAARSAGEGMLSEEALRRACVEAWLSTDSDFLKHAVQNAIPDGSTGIAVFLLSPTALGAPRRLMVVNVGDSRAAMVHVDGSARPLSEDHKPNRADEKMRVEAAGGHVIFAGCWRVQGDLAVSRAFGDCHLKRFGVSAEPEIALYEVTPKDAFLVLASDGLWDVVGEVQCAKTVLRSHDTVSAAAALCELASDRGSMDNITALVVDLR